MTSNAHPESVKAILFACQCFAIGDKQLQTTLDGFRERNPEAYSEFPKQISRSLMERAKKKRGKHSERLLVIAREALYERIRRKSSHKSDPLFGFTGQITDEILTSLLRLYDRLLPELYGVDVTKPEALRVLIENVFLPAVHVQLVQRWPEGLGNEFWGGECWYLPSTVGGKSIRPFPKLLDRWLRTTGFRTAYGITRDLEDEALRVKLDRWLEGEDIPDLEALHHLVDTFASQVDWLDAPDSWKARFTLARAMHIMCCRLDEILSEPGESYSLKLGALLSQIDKEGFVPDMNHVLIQPSTFFAARLVLLRLKSDGTWCKHISAKAVLAKALTGSVEAQIWQLNSGNWLLEQMIGKPIGAVRTFTTEESSAFEDAVFSVGAHEIRQLLEMGTGGC